MNPKQYEEYWDLLQEIEEELKKGRWMLFDLKRKALRESCRTDLFLLQRFRCIYIPTSIHRFPLTVTEEVN